MGGGRDGLVGDSFIIVGDEERHDRREDLCLGQDSEPADAAHLDLVAAARTYLPVVIEEVRSLRTNSRPMPSATDRSCDTLRFA